MMRSVRWRMALGGLLATASLGFMAQPAAAIHQGATLDCGSLGTYTLDPATNKVGAFPSFTAVNLLERNGKVVGTLIPFAFSDNGVWIDLEGNAEGPLSDHVGLATCSFTGSNGHDIVLVGLLNLR